MSGWCTRSSCEGQGLWWVQTSFLPSLPQTSASPPLSSTSLLRQWRVQVPKPETCQGGAPEAPARGKGCGKLQTFPLSPPPSSPPSPGSSPPPKSPCSDNGESKFPSQTHVRVARQRLLRGARVVVSFRPPLLPGPWVPPSSTCGLFFAVSESTCKLATSNKSKFFV